MSEKIAVLGAGPMGLAVAYELIKNGKKNQQFLKLMIVLVV